MTATSISSIMSGIAARLATIDGLRTLDDGTAPEQINPPTAIVGVPPIEKYHQSFAMGYFQLQVPIYVLTSAAVSRVGQLQLAAYADPTGDQSIREAIEGDKTLGGAVDDCAVIDFRPLGMEEVGAIGYFGGVFNLLVIGRGA